MKFLYYDIIFLAVFCISLIAFLIKKRKNIKVEGRIFLLYPTKFGVKLIDKIGSKYKRFFNVLSYIVIATGYLVMISSIWLFIDLLGTLMKMPMLFKVIKVPPIMPIFPYFTNVFKVDYLPPFYFTYWIISIAIIAVIHEFAHGIFARFYGVRIKSTGFGFLGPFIAAFVEPDEKKLQKKSKKAQIAVLSAGSFANLAVTAVFGVLILLFIKIFFIPSGVLFDTYITNSVNISDITQIGNESVSNLSINDFSGIVKNFDKNYFDLSIRMDSESINLTKITAGNKTFFGMIDMMLLQVTAIEKNKDNISDEIIVFDDTPAIRAGIAGAISKINSAKINNLTDLKKEFSKYKPNETITIEVIDKDYNAKDYIVTLAENQKNKTQAMLGIAFITEIGTNKTWGIVSFARKIGERFREPRVFYKPSFNPSLIIFIYNLLWWIIFLNLSVALVNMLPLGIFDGGRVFYLTMFAITKSKKKAKMFFKIAMLLILLIFIILTIMWMVNI